MLYTRIVANTYITNRLRVAKSKLTSRGQACKLDYYKNAPYTSLKSLANPQLAINGHL